MLEARCGRRHGAARREAGTNSVAGGRGSQHPFDRRGSGRSAAHCQQLAAALCRARHWRIEDWPRAGKKPIYGKATNKRILALLDKPPPQGYARWTGPLLAKALGDVDVQYVWRFLREHTIDLAARKSWCESNDLSFVAKAADVVGLYVDPPVKAIVLCVDEKPSIQALERAQGYLKLPTGAP